MGIGTVWMQRKHIIFGGLKWGAAKQRFVVLDSSAYLFEQIILHLIFIPKSVTKLQNLSEGIYFDFTTAFMKKQLEKGRFFAEVMWTSINTLILSFFFSLPEENNGFHTNSDKELFQLENAAVKTLTHSNTSLNPPNPQFLCWIIW